MNKWICRGCGREATHIRTIIEGLRVIDQCSHPECGNLHSIDATIPDVYWNGRPYHSEALGIEFTSRSQKARAMKEMGVSELGSQKLGEKSWVEGSRDYRHKQFDKDRPAIRETYRRYLKNARGK